MAPNTNQPPAETPAVAEHVPVELTAESVEQIATAVAAKLNKPAASARGRGAMSSTFAERQAARLGKKPARGESK